MQRVARAIVRRPSCPHSAHSATCPQSTTPHVHHRLNGHFPGQPGSVGSPSVFFLHLFLNRTFQDNWHRSFYRLDALPVTLTKPSMHQMKPRALTPTRKHHSLPLPSFTLHPPNDFLLKGRCSLYAGFQHQHPKSEVNNTSSSAAAERPREPLSQLKSCQLLHNRTKNHISLEGLPFHVV